jgi:hypothetical protein
LLDSSHRNFHSSRAGRRSIVDDRSGLCADTGQINPGNAAQPWSAAPALPQDRRPAQKDARAALMMPDNGAPSAGGPDEPIGATMQTMPAKFSHRNDLLDHIPITAWLLPLNEQQRQQIYKSVMADKSQPAGDAAALKPGDSLPFYVKGKDKVLLVRPSTGIVVDEASV